MGKGMDKVNASGMGQKKMLDSIRRLIECLLDMKNLTHWSADNGMSRFGYFQQLEKWMEAKISGTDIKGIPHIRSRLKLWKKQYNAIPKMLGAGASGFG